ncbi:hypothetical protein F4804DRAFT_227792 [Jackrogersella minutella]|nr:hypothetical protein F4804DRAFT_227792 [Jackrogersella minutella]
MGKSKNTKPKKQTQNGSQGRSSYPPFIDNDSIYDDQIDNMYDHGHMNNPFRPPFPPPPLQTEGNGSGGFPNPNPRYKGRPENYNPNYNKYKTSHNQQQQHPPAPFQPSHQAPSQQTNQQPSQQPPFQPPPFQQQSQALVPAPQETRKSPAKPKQQQQAEHAETLHYHHHNHYYHPADGASPFPTATAAGRDGDVAMVDIDTVTFYQSQFAALQGQVRELLAQMAGQDASGAAFVSYWVDRVCRQMPGSELAAALT